jgi:thiaminase/transcriptional activator TenA
MRLYAYIGQTLAAKGIPNHDYTDWIKTYSSDEFQPLVRQLDALVDQYAPDDARTASTFRYAMVCERDFFEAAWNAG